MGCYIYNKQQLSGDGGNRTRVRTGGYENIYMRSLAIDLTVSKQPNQLSIGDPEKI